MSAEPTPAAVPVDLEAVRALCDAASPAPWVADGSEIYSEFEGGPWVGETCHPDDPEKTEADSAFIAAARTLVPELVDEVERLRAFVDRLISFDDPDPASTGFQARRAVTMTRIIDEARAARGEVR